MTERYGFLTLATPRDYLKAIGLALSLRVSNPNVPIAVACSPTLRDRIGRYFDYVIDEKPELRGFVHKVHIDDYSPFQETMFFDADVLVFKLAGGRRVIMRPSGTEPKLKSYYEVRIAVGATEAISDARARGVADLAKLRDAHQAMLT